jgi:hypothetical protein
MRALPTARQLYGVRIKSECNQHANALAKT